MGVEGGDKNGRSNPLYDHVEAENSNPLFNPDRLLAHLGVEFVSVDIEAEHELNADDQFSVVPQSLAAMSVAERLQMERGAGALRAENPLSGRSQLLQTTSVAEI